MILYTIFKTGYLIGVATTTESLHSLIEQCCAKEGESYTEEMVVDLLNMRKTQCYKGNGEFEVGEIEADKIL